MVHPLLQHPSSFLLPWLGNIVLIAALLIGELGETRFCHAISDAQVACPTTLTSLEVASFWAAFVLLALTSVWLSQVLAGRARGHPTQRTQSDTAK